MNTPTASRLRDNNKREWLGLLDGLLVDLFQNLCAVIAGLELGGDDFNHLNGAIAGRSDEFAGLGVVQGPGLVHVGGHFIVRPADVVAIGVVGVLAEMLLELGGHHAALSGLLDGQADATPVDVEIDDLHPQLLAGGDHLLGQLDVMG